MDRSCIMFNCLWQLWDWLDPPVLTSSASMEGKKMAPPGQRPAPQSNHYSEGPQYPQAVTLQPHQPPVGPRSPLLENPQELYGTRQPTELARQYALREQQQMASQRLELQQRSMPATNSSYSLQSPSQDPIMSAPVPPGYNASVHQAYLRRNQHQLGDHQQIYQNHPSLYQPPGQQARLYQPYTSRIQQPSYISPAHSHTQLLRQQYNELQQMKLHQQMQYQSQAQMQQQQTFAQRQILHQHLHSRQHSQQNLSQYSASPSTAQLNEINARLNRKHENNMQEDYGYLPNRAKQAAVSPSSKNSAEPLSSPGSKSTSGSEGRRSSSGTSQALRSPVAQRPPTAPVTKAGWLYKQGSDGLKVWRKRWFVLSEYCLFYYKGQEEDKLLGSVLLPSYVVSPVASEEKGARKWSFKCEHANMRTYVLAAPDQRSMDQWLRVLTMAAIMQDGVGSGAEKMPQPGTQSSHERRNKPSVTPGEADDSAPETSAGAQHMYENAPPKPRRSNEGYQSPSPERVDRYDPNYDILREPSVYRGGDNSQQKFVKNRMNTKSPNNVNAEAIYESKSASSNYAAQRNLSKSPEAIYSAHNLSLPLTNTHSNRLDGNKSPSNSNVPNTVPARTTHSNETRMLQNKSPAYFDNNTLPQDNVQKYYQLDTQNIYVESDYHKMLQQQEMNQRLTERTQGQPQNMGRANASGSFVERQSFERRTPDTYGRSMIVPGYYSKGRSGDYEDVYHNSANTQNYQSREQSYPRPMSPVAYEDTAAIPVQLPHQRYAEPNVDTSKIYQAPSVQMRQKKLPHNYSAPTLPHSNVPRPHSADFLEYEAKNASYDSTAQTRHVLPSSRQPPRPKSSLDINSHNDYNGDSYYYSEASYAEKMRQSAHYLRNKSFGSTVFPPRQSDPRSPEYIKERKMSMPSFRDESHFETEMRMERDPIYGIRDQNRNVSGSDKYRHSELTGPNSNWTLRNKSLSQIMSQEDVYNRSNSAMSEGSSASGLREAPGDPFLRSASARLPSTAPDGPRHGDKLQQREESMKRLLEWKQRMLQSPLTRKPTPATLSLARSLPLGHGPPGLAAPARPQPAYNSYSSDDEASMSASLSGVEGRRAAIPVRAVSPRVRQAVPLWSSQTHIPQSVEGSQPVRAVSPRVRRASDVEERSRLNTDETPEHRQDNLQRLESLRRHLSDLERHYSKSKPLVHLVDNMVKLGALYHRGPTTIDVLEQNQILREKALMEQAQEQRRWAESCESLSREQVEARVEQLRAMERSVAGEARALRGLRGERLELQRALGGAHLQHDLSRVHSMLAVNSKKLEQTVAGNARLEQELAVLRLKLQGHPSSYAPEELSPCERGSDVRTAADATALLEDELKRVQQLVGELQQQRQDLSVAVRQLTQQSHSLGLVSSTSDLPAASYDFSGDAPNISESAAAKKRLNPPWVETDLDTGMLEGGPGGSQHMQMTPLYIDTVQAPDQRPPSPEPGDDLGLGCAFANLSNVEKQEIKTVRIVKRESERRQRDRERSSLQCDWGPAAPHPTAALDQLLEEDAQYSSRSASLPRALPASYQQQGRQQHANPPSTLSLSNVNHPFDNKFVSSPSLINNNDYTTSNGDGLQMSRTKYGYQKSAQILPLPVSSNNYSLSKHSASHSAPYTDGSMSDLSRTSYTNGPMSPALSKTASISSLTKGHAELSPVFTSEAARQIIIEMAGEKNGVVKSNGSQHRRSVPKEKRRHYTAPHHLSAKALDPTSDGDFFYQENWYQSRARDDVDMERVLRGGAGSAGRAGGPPPLAAPPDVVRSTLPAPLPDHYSESTIDRLLAAPNKILIPERYIPEQAPELSPEEQKKRMEKVESIKKMLSSTTPSGDPSKSPDDNDKRQREHLLQLNQILAKQVMEMSKIVAGSGADTGAAPPLGGAQP